MDLTFVELTFVQARFVEQSSKTLSLSIGIHLTKVVLINDCDGNLGVDGEHLLDPVRLETEWAPHERQKAGELGRGLRRIEAVKLRDEARVNNMGHDLVGDLITGQNVFFSSD